MEPEKKALKEVFDTKASSTTRAQRLKSMASSEIGRPIRRNTTASRISMTSSRLRKGSVRHQSDGADAIPSQDIEQHRDICGIFMDNIVLILVLLSLMAGFALGAILNPSNLSARQLSLLRLPGEMFERFLLCLLVPLCMTSVVCAVGGRPTAQGARLTLRALAYFVLTTVWAALCGVILALLIGPGVGAKELPPYPKLEASLGVDTLLDIFRNAIPDNFVEAFMLLTRTKAATSNATKNKFLQFDQGRRAPGSLEATEGGEEILQDKVADTNVSGLVFFSLLVGFALSRSAPADLQMTSPGTDVSSPGTQAGRGRQPNMLLRVCRVLSLRFMRMAELTLWYTPIAVSVLIAADMSRVADLSRVLWHLGLYAFTVVLGLAFHAFLFLPILYMTRVRRGAGSFFFNLLHPLAIAFGTSSSLAASPVAMATLERRVGLDPTMVRLVIPLGCVLNHDGTALYGTVSTMFAAQLQGAEMGFSFLVALVVACCVATMGMFGLPPAYRGAALTALLLAVVGLPSDRMGYIVVVHWVLDRCCSSVNLMGDCVGAAILQESPSTSSVNPCFPSGLKKEIPGSTATGLGQRRPTNFKSPPPPERPKAAEKEALKTS
ncbi:excitatory amino acid transporter-like isoform X2 [Amblyomma americanum]